MDRMLFAAALPDDDALFPAPFAMPLEDPVAAPSEAAEPLIFPNRQTDRRRSTPE